MLLSEKNQIIESKKDCFVLTPLIQNRGRRIKKMPGELASDEAVTQPVDVFKINTYFIIIDIVTTQIKERFNED